MIGGRSERWFLSTSVLDGSDGKRLDFKKQRRWWKEVWRCSCKDTLCQSSSPTTCMDAITAAGYKSETAGSQANVPPRRRRSGISSRWGRRGVRVNSDVFDGNWNAPRWSGCRFIPPQIPLIGFFPHISFNSPSWHISAIQTHTHTHVFLLNSYPRSYVLRSSRGEQTQQTQPATTNSFKVEESCKRKVQQKVLSDL